MGGTVEAPAPRDYGQETRDTLQAQVDLAPAQYEAEAQFRPKYAQLDLDTLAQTLRGSGGTDGLMALYEKEVYPVLSRIQNADRDTRIAGELGAIDKYAGSVTKTLREATGSAPLIDEMNKQALEGLQAGAGLDESLAREVSQGARAAAADRGFGFGSTDAVAEAFARGSRGNQLRNERRGFASQAVGMNQLTGGDPLMAILGRPSQTLSMGPQIAGQGQSFNPGKVFNPESGYAQDLYNTNFNANAAAKIASANNEAAITSSMISAAGSVGSSA